MAVVVPPQPRRLPSGQDRSLLPGGCFFLNRDLKEVHLRGTLLTLKLPATPEAELTEQHIALAQAIETMAIGFGVNIRQ